MWSSCPMTRSRQFPRNQGHYRVQQTDKAQPLPALQGEGSGVGSVAITPQLCCRRLLTPPLPLPYNGRGVATLRYAQQSATCATKLQPQVEKINILIQLSQAKPRRGGETTGGGVTPDEGGQRQTECRRYDRAGQVCHPFGVPTTGWVLARGGFRPHLCSYAPSGLILFAFKTCET